MMIDENTEPMGSNEAQKPASAGTAHDETATATIAPAPDANPEPSSHEPVHTPVPASPEPVRTPDPEPLPASDPHEPEQPAVPGDPMPAPAPPEQPGPTTPAPPVPHAEAPSELAPESAAVHAPEPRVPDFQASREPEPTPVVEEARRSERSDDDMSLFEAAMSAMDGGEGAESDGGFKKLSKGDRVEATVIQVDRDRLFVDLGTKSEGIVPLGEMSEDNIESAKDHFQVGDKINVIVLRPEGAEGNPIVSKKRADFEEVWDRIENSFRSGEMITAQVVDRVKGGLVVDVGVRGFVPATHVGSGKLRNIEKYVGQPLQLKVIEIDRERKKVVLSNREAEEQRRVRAKEDVFTNVQPGDTLDGTVRRLTDYGAFVDLGGVDGLLHISEMSWMRINHPKEMFKEGQKIKVMVLRLDAAAGKISLGHRQVLPDPWNLIRQNYTVGQKFTVKIGRIVQSGAFVKLPEGAEAFLPVSEMSFRRIKRPDEVLEEEQEVEAQIIDLRPDERRMVLSLRAAGSVPEAGRGGDERSGGYQPASEYGGGDDMRGGEKRGKKKIGGGKKVGGAGGGARGRGREEDDFEEVAGRRGFATGGATIGERLGMLKGLLGHEEEDEPEVAETHESAETHEVYEVAEAHPAVTVEKPADEA